MTKPKENTKHRRRSVSAVFSETETLFGNGAAFVGTFNDAGECLGFRLVSGDPRDAVGEYTRAWLRVAPIGGRAHWLDPAGSRVPASRLPFAVQQGAGNAKA